MHILIYLSSASYLFSEDELIKILNTSRQNNARLDITGLLLYHEGSILQILEGEEQTLTRLFNTISMDSRHKRIIKMIDLSISERNFEDWTMGFKQVSAEDWSQLNGYLNLDDKTAFTKLSSSGSNAVVTMIKSFKNVNMGALSGV